jgi:hypothetical protein
MLNGRSKEIMVVLTSKEETASGRTATPKIQKNTPQVATQDTGRGRNGDNGNE